MNKTPDDILKENGKQIGFRYAYSWDDIIKAMKEYASQERLKGIEEGFMAARESERKGKSYGAKYQDYSDYLKSKNLV